MKKIGIVTLHTGYNYGSSLQTFASKIFYKKLGYYPIVLGYSNSLVKGRDIRLEKLFVMFLRTFWRPSLFKKTFLTYSNSLKKDISVEAKERFLNFSNKYLEVEKLNRKEMIEFGKNKDVLAVVCGSDQIWNSTAIYIDPFYYLKFFPRNKRMAYAPSFGKSIVPSYNKKIITKNLKEIKYLSIREIEGQKIIKELLGKEVEVLLDPTLLLNKNEWSCIGNGEYNDKYVVFYFLDSPTDETIKKIKYCTGNEDVKIISIPYIHENMKNEFKNIFSYDIGPLEFINLIKNAQKIYTDSYHGMLFSINFNKDFFIFERNYGAAHNQSSRIESILEILGIKNRFYKEKDLFLNEKIYEKIDWNKVNIKLEEERIKSQKYILDCFKDIEGKNEE